MIYRKLKRVSTNGYANYIKDFTKIFPELSKIDSEEMADRWYRLGIEFYTDEQKKVSPILRLTLPFALIMMLLMFISLPFNFMITGNWGYSFGKNNRVYNWFKALKLQ